MRNTPTRVYLALGWYEPGHMQGIYSYACEKGWTLNRWQLDHMHEVRRFQPHGIISQLFKGVSDLVKAVEEARVPTVELCKALPQMRVPRVIPDAEAEGATAAAHLLDRGFTRFVFIGYSDLEEYRKGFIHAARAAGTDVLVVNINDPKIQRETGEFDPHFNRVHDELSALRRAWARRFFSDCDKPVGVYVLSAVWADDIIEGCRDAHILVPEQVAVVTKAELSGEGSSRPVPLTVLAPDYEAQGYQAAQLLDRMINGEQIPPDTVIKVPPCPLVPRDSTLCYATGNLHIARAATFIMRNLHDPALCVKLVCRAAKAPRCTFYSDFTRHFKMPVAHYIEHMRIKEAVKLLVSTNASAGEIAAQCGFGELLRFQRALLRTTGLGPRAYRQKYRKAAAQPGRGTTRGRRRPTPSSLTP